MCFLFMISLPVKKHLDSSLSFVATVLYLVLQKAYRKHGIIKLLKDHDLKQSVFP